jgi:ABC-type branched-subunit amino acid transport system substrate-binding protein
VSQVTEQEQIPHLYFNPSGGGEVPDYCNNYLFNLGASARMAAGNEVTDYLMSEYGKDWYTLGSDLSLSRNLSSLHADKLAENGGSMLGEKYVQFGVTDFTSILEDIEAEDPDVVFSPLTVNSAIAFMRQAQERGIRDSIQSIQFFMSHGSFEDTDPDTVKGALQTTEYYQNIETDMNQQFVSAYQDKYGPEVGPHQYDGKVYHAYQLLDQAIQTGGSTAAADITNELTDLAPTSTIYGESSIGHDNQAKIKYRIGRVNSDNEFETEKAFGPIVSDPVCE